MGCKIFNKNNSLDALSIRLDKYKFKVHAKQKKILQIFDRPNVLFVVQLYEQLAEIKQQLKNISFRYSRNMYRGQLEQTIQFSNAILLQLNKNFIIIEIYYKQKSIAKYFEFNASQSDYLKKIPQTLKALIIQLDSNFYKNKLDYSLWRLQQNTQTWLTDLTYINIQNQMNKQLICKLIIYKYATQWNNNSNQKQQIKRTYKQLINQLSKYGLRLKFPNPIQNQKIVNFKRYPRKYLGNSLIAHNLQEFLIEKDIKLKNEIVFIYINHEKQEILDSDKQSIYFNLNYKIKECYNPNINKYRLLVHIEIDYFDNFQIYNKVDLQHQLKSILKVRNDAQTDRRLLQSQRFYTSNQLISPRVELPKNKKILIHEKPIINQKLKTQYETQTKTLQTNEALITHYTPRRDLIQNKKILNNESKMPNQKMLFSNKKKLFNFKIVCFPEYSKQYQIVKTEIQQIYKINQNAKRQLFLLILKNMHDRGGLDLFDSQLNYKFKQFQQILINGPALILNFSPKCYLTSKVLEENIVKKMKVFGHQVNKVSSKVQFIACQYNILGRKINFNEKSKIEFLTKLDILNDS